MKRALPLTVVIVAVTALLLFAGLRGGGHASGILGVASGSALPGFSADVSTPDQAIANFLLDIQKRNWDRAFSVVDRTASSLNEQDFIQAWVGANGGLRSFSNLGKIRCASTACY